MSDSREGSAPSNAPHLRFPSIAPATIAPAQRRDELKITQAQPGQDPEEAIVERVHTVGIQLTHGGRSLTGGLEGRSMPSAVSEAYGRAGTLAQNLKTRCASCAHFDQPSAKPYIEASLAEMRKGVARGPGGQTRNMLQQQQAWMVLHTREATIAASGICHALTEACGVVTLTHPDGGCPLPAQLRGKNGEDVSGLYKEREVKRHARAPGVFAYDKIMNAAAGKKD